MITPYHALLTAAELMSVRGGADRLLSAVSSANIEVFPYQIAAAEFALQTPLFKGAVLADEGSLGKTFEVLLVISQLWFEGNEKIIIIVPAPLLLQWSDIINGRFSVPFEIAENADSGENPFDCNAVVLTSYEFAFQNADKIAEINWNTAVFDEAHRLSKIYTGENKTASVLKNAVGGALKLLLTATPIQNSIMDLYGLLYFIDETILPDEKTFYARYFRKPENYGELAETARLYCFRTLRKQAENYVKIPQRLPISVSFNSFADEKNIYDLIDKYLIKPDKKAFPQMESYDLQLLLTRTLSSSVKAFENLLKNTLERVYEPELDEMRDLCGKIRYTAKNIQFLNALKFIFPKLKKLGAERKALIFTESLVTQKYLQDLLTKHGYKALIYNGNTRDYDIIKQFKEDENAEILIATDIAAEGFNLEFCSFIANYDLPYNILNIEQRIMRCHRQNQQNEVIVLNFFNKDNFADVRTLELINKRIAQFDGIFGMSDDIAGNFCENSVDKLVELSENMRTKIEIDRDFKQTLELHQEENSAIAERAENVLFTTFNRETAEKVVITPKYAKEMSEKINAKLWELTKWFFANKDGYHIDEAARTLHVGITPEKAFTGAALRRREYSISDKTLSLTSSIAKNIFQEIFWRGVPEYGEITVKPAPENHVRNLTEQVEICYNKVKIKCLNDYAKNWIYYVFAGKTASGRILSDEECREIMALPVADFKTRGETHGGKDVNKPQSPHKLDKFIDIAALKNRAATEMNGEAKSIKITAERRKTALKRGINAVVNELKQLELDLSRTENINARLKMEKCRADLQKELKIREQSLFLDSVQIDAEAEETIKKLTEIANLTAEIQRFYVITVKLQEEKINHE